MTKTEPKTLTDPKSTQVSLQYLRDEIEARRNMQWQEIVMKINSCLFRDEYRPATDSVTETVLSKKYG